MRRNNSKHVCRDIEDLRTAFNNVSMFGTETARFMAQALMFICERLETQKRGRKQPSAWNLFFGKGMKAGKAPSDIAKEWRARPRLKKVG